VALQTSVVQGLPCYVSRNLFYVFGRSPWTGIRLSQSFYLHKTTYTWNESKCTSISRVVFKPTIPLVNFCRRLAVLRRAVLKLLQRGVLALASVIVNLHSEQSDKLR
jgi:hypothetical protein